MSEIAVKDKIGVALKAFNECRWQDAIPILNEVFSADPSNIDIGGKLGFALSQARLLNDAIEIFKQLSIVQPEKAIWPYMVGYQFYAKSEWQQSIEWFDKALRLNPDYIKCLYRKGYAQTRAGKREEAMETLKHCLKIWEESDESTKQTDRKYYGNANFLLGKSYLNVGLSLKARRPLEIAVSFDDDDCDKRYELGKCLLQNGNIDGAIEQLTAADSLRGGVDYVLDRLAQAFIAKGDKTKAEELYCSIPGNQRRSFVLKNLGSLYLDLGQPDKALPLLRNAVARDRESFKAHYFLGQALEGVSQLRAARQAYSKAVELRQKRYNKDFPEATLKIEQLDLALKDAPEDNSLDNKGIIEFYDSKRGYGFIRSEIANFGEIGRLFGMKTATCSVKSATPGGRRTKV
jgi:tetratricopeptide (TPR) repeat protein